MQPMGTALFLAGGLVCLTVGAELLVRGSVRLAMRLGVSSFFIGLTIVGFGTSTPELATSVGAALRGQSDICLGNVVGSNIFNIAAILGIAALIAPIPVTVGAVRREVPIVIAVSLLPYVSLATERVVTPVWGLLFLSLLLVFVWQGYRKGRLESAAFDVPLVTPRPGQDLTTTSPLAFWTPVGLSIAGGLVLLVAGSEMLVRAATAIARALGVSDLAIALTIVAGGTSLPELFTSVIGAIRKEADLAVGNVLGSNVFNLLGIVGVSSLLRPQEVNPQILRFDAPVMLLVSLACVPIMLSKHSISRKEGTCLIIAYVVYVILLFRMGVVTP